MQQTRAADAIPVFAREYEVRCQKCHTVIPALNEFGLQFRERGFRMPDGVKPGPTFPVSGRLNLAYTSEPDPTGLPKAIVDEVELFLAGTAGSRSNYFIEQYLVDGGQHGLLRDAWVNTRLNPFEAKIPVNFTIGRFALPLPVDPEAFRQTNAHYAVFDQTVGDNPFNFFDDKNGANLRVGDGTRGFSITTAALQGHDTQSGLPSKGLDTMVYAQHVMGAFQVGAYRYDGTRPDNAVFDRFSRQGYSVTYTTGKLQLDNVLQQGWDSSTDGASTAGTSSGGFAQARWQFSPRYFALARYDGTNSSIDGLARSTLVLFGYRPSHNAALSAEDVITTNPVGKHTLNIQYTVGY